MGGDGEGGDEDRGYGTGTGVALQVNCAVGVVIWERDLGGDGGHDKSTRGISSSGIQTDFRDYGRVYDERRMGVALGG